MRLIFMGTPDFAVPTLIELAARGHEIAAVYTRAPKPAGRGMDVQHTPVEREAAAGMRRFPEIAERSPLHRIEQRVVRQQRELRRVANLAAGRGAATA